MYLAKIDQILVYPPSNRKQEKAAKALLNEGGNESTPAKPTHWIRWKDLSEVQMFVAISIVLTLATIGTLLWTAGTSVWMWAWWLMPLGAAVENTVGAPIVNRFKDWRYERQLPAAVEERNQQALAKLQKISISDRAVVMLRRLDPEYKRQLERVDTRRDAESLAKHAWLRDITRRMDQLRPYLANPMVREVVGKLNDTRAKMLRDKKGKAYQKYTELESYLERFAQSCVDALEAARKGESELFGFSVADRELSPEETWTAEADGLTETLRSSMPHLVA